MSIKSTLLGRPPVYDAAKILLQDGVTAVNIRLDEAERWDHGQARRVLRAVLVTDRRALTLGEDVYPSALGHAEVMGSMLLGVQRDNMLFVGLQAAAVLERKGIKTLLLDGKSVDKVERELGIVRPGIERR